MLVLDGPCLHDTLQCVVQVFFATSLEAAAPLRCSGGGCAPPLPTQCISPSHPMPRVGSIPNAAILSSETQPASRWPPPCSASSSGPRVEVPGSRSQGRWPDVAALCRCCFHARARWLQATALVAELVLVHGHLGDHGLKHDRARSEAGFFLFANLSPSDFRGGF